MPKKPPSWDQRVREKHFSAEEPVTVRIRRRTEGAPASGQDTEHGFSSHVEPPVSMHYSNDRISMRFEDRILLEQQEKDQEPSLS
jgi:hypothetical protein